jgi:putative sterol carrier protein
MAVNLPKDAQELFDVLVPQGLKQFPDKAREVNAIYAFKISGEGGGEWTADLTSDPPTIVKGDTGKAQCTIEVAHDDFKTMLSDPNAGMQLYFQGKLRVSGDPMLAMKLQQFFDIAKQG